MRIIFGFILMVMIPMLVISALSAYFYISSGRQERISSLNTLTLHASEQISAHINNMSHISKAPLHNGTVMMRLHENSKSPDGRFEFDSQKEIEHFLESVLYIDTDVASVIIYNERGQSISRMRRFYLTLSGAYDLVSTEDHEKIIQSQGRNVMLGEQTILTGGRWPNLQVVSAGRALRDYHGSFDIIAVIIVSIETEKFADICNSINTSDGQITLLVSGEGDVICSAPMMDEHRELGTTLIEGISAEHKEMYIDSDVVNTRYIVSGSPVSGTDWYVFSLIPEAGLELYSGIPLLTTIMIILVSVIATLISVFFSIRVTSPIRKVVQAMESFGEGNYEIEIDSSDKNELYQISHHFNRMIKKINSLDKMYYRAQYKQKEAELNALKLQINPHFLFNTLESIHMVAEINNDKDASVMARQLGRFYRYYIIESEEETVPVSDEMLHLTSYIALLKVRFGDKFTFEFDIPDAIQKVRVLKFIFQPIVENAVFHGLVSVKSGGLIKISAKEEDKRLVFEVSDNGAGIDQTELIRLQESFVSDGEGLLSNAKPADIGIGLQNVNQRLKLYYGGSFALEIDSNEGEGTVIRVKVPNA